VQSIIAYTNLDSTELVVVCNGAAQEAEQICVATRQQRIVEYEDELAHPELISEQDRPEWEARLNASLQVLRERDTELPISLLWYPDAIGYPKACNAGIKASDSEFVILFNDDCLLLSQSRNEWVDVLMQPFLQSDKVGITGPQRIWDENSEHSFLIFFCVMLRRTCLDEIGLLDESTGMGFGEDTIACIEAERKGWKVLKVPDDHLENTLADIDPHTTTLETWKHDKLWVGNFRLFHDAESTLGRIPESEAILRKNRAMLRERYGKKEVNTPTDGCTKCGGPTWDGVCLGTEGKLNCDGVYVWRASLVDGWFGADEGQWLAQQVMALPPNSKILEIGSWHGRSSRFIADNLSEDSQVWCCDTFNGSSGEPEMHGTAHWDRGDHAFQWWWCNLQEHIMGGRVVPVRMHSENAAHTFTHLVEKGQLPKFDLIFIDGDHSEEGIKKDVEAWLPLLKEGGLMCGHDYYKESEGPWWVHVRQFVEARFPKVQKAATSIWYVRPHEVEDKAAKEARALGKCWYVEPNTPRLHCWEPIGHDGPHKCFVRYASEPEIGTEVECDAAIRSQRFTVEFLENANQGITEVPTFDYEVSESERGPTALPQGGEAEYSAVIENEHRTMIDKWFEAVPINAAILDLGCGSGVAVKMLRERGFVNVLGVDVKGGEGVTQSDMHSLPLADNSIDIIYSVHSLEHAADPLKVLSECKRVLKPEGQLFLILPYPDYIYDEHRLNVHCGSIPLGLNKVDNAQSLLKTLEQSGFTPLSAEGGYLRNESEIYLQLKSERGHVYDCFIYNDEQEILEIRLATLYDHVDRFVLVEGTLTHSGHPKPLHFEEHKERFSKYLDKISHVVVDNYPEVADLAGASELDNTANKAWVRERHQRDHIMVGLEGCRDNDIVLIGDADEIVNPEVLKTYDVSQGLCRLKQRLFYYYLNCENKAGWDWLKIAPYKVVKELTPCGIRYPPAGHTPLIENGGWHFSFVSDVEGMMQKVRDYAHVEYATDEFLNKERIEKLISEGRDIFGRDEQYEFVIVDDSYPQYVRDNYNELETRGLIRLRLSDTVGRLETAWKDLDEALNRHGLIDGGKVIEFKQPIKPHTVTACVSTKDRYQTTLAPCISAIVNQTRKPEKLKIYDDGAQENLFELAPFSGLLRLAQDKGIDVEVLSTPRKGQVGNHQHCLDNATTEVVWRVDDDELPEPDCLANLLAELKDGVGAVAGLVHHPANVQPLPADLSGNLTDIDRGNLQWYEWNSGPREVEHLYSTFAYKVSAAKEAGGYPMELSPVGHREESIFSARINRAGYKLLVTPHAKTIHLQEATGGIRSYHDGTLWQHDERVFQEYLKAWGLPVHDTKMVVCDFGLGDHLILKGIWGELKRKFPERKWTLALCFPEVFAGEDATIISIADAKLLLGSRYDEHSVYRYAWDNNFVKPMPEVMMEFFSK